ncbi:hypothetical protein G8V07_14615 [Clostridium botulinum D/C]|uniref:hypothetical protein n=1 Tax=Clostridium botulinum TaxID=1491 RepID=UPI001E39111F|nr:hypothetical protein [Clostridium botulinum]MCD3321676.1 hypothetical protein [Clostridium botulinum D/C]MCD3324956.1 hypothetical protein [Clostridium botulinum D/C]MCD3327734.1 hypothetical protein [Clostridium botulinum D/C]
MQCICYRCGYANVGIMSCCQITDNKVEITYICPICGEIEVETHYLYSMNNLKKKLN